MSDDLPSLVPVTPTVTADQFPVAGDEVLVRAVFGQLTRNGCEVRIKAPSGAWRIVTVDGLQVLTQLRVGHVLETYGQR